MMKPVRFALAASLLACGCAAPPKLPQRFIPVAYCPRTAAPPKLDGNLNDRCWRAAGVLEDFMLNRDDAFPPRKTQARIVRDEKWIYLAFRCMEDDMAHAHVQKTGRALLWYEDSVEIFIDARRGDSDYAQFGGNVLGASNLPIPPGEPQALLAKGKSRGDRWTLECRVLIKGLTKTPPADGEVWGLNLCRNRRRGGVNECTSWARLKGGFHVPDIFGLLVFCEKLPRVRVTNVYMPGRHSGDNVALVRLAGPAATAASVALTSTGRRERRKARLDSIGLASVGVPYRLGAGANSLTLTVEARKRQILKAAFRAVPSARPMWVRYAPNVGSFALAVNHEVIRQGEELQGSIQAAMEDSDRPAPRVAWSLLTTDPLPMRRVAPDGRFAIDQHMPDGEAMLTARLIEPSGNTVATLRRKVAIAGKALARCGLRAGICRDRASKLRAKLKGEDELLCLDKAQTKIGVLKGLVTARSADRAADAAEEIEHHVARLEKGLLPVWGHHECLYTSGIDGSRQPYAIAVPKTYDPNGTDRLPALIWLHGFLGDDPWPREGLMQYMGPMELACMKKGFIFVYPFGRGSQGYRHDGEADVWAVWKAVNERWRIDPDRVYLAGFSMGGAGTARLSAAHPHVFAAAAVYSGWLGKGLFANLRHLPMRFEAGGQEGGQRMVAYHKEGFAKVGGRVADTVLLSHPNAGHTTGYVDYEALLDWFGKFRRVTDPPVVTCATSHLRHNRAYWLSIDAFETYGQPARADARIDRGRLAVTTSNVAALTLRPPPRLLARPLHVTLNGKPVPDATLEKGAIELRVAPRPAGPLAKDLLLCGPIRDAFTRELILVAAANDKATLDAAEIVAARWRRWHHGRLEVRPESQISVGDIGGRSIILVGPWKAEELMARVAAAAPVKIDPKGITVSGRRKEGKDLGIIFVYPRGDAGNYFVAITGQSPAGVLAACKMFAQGAYRGDYAVTADGPSGYFDASWK